MTAARAVRIVGFACLFVAVLDAASQAYSAYELISRSMSYPEALVPSLLALANLLLLVAGLGMLLRMRWARPLAMAYAVGAALLVLGLPLVQVAWRVAWTSVPGSGYSYSSLETLFPYAGAIVGAVQQAAFPALLLGFMAMGPVAAVLRRDDAAAALPPPLAPLFGGINLLVGLSKLGVMVYALLNLARVRFMPGATATVVADWSWFRGSLVIGLLYLVSGIGLLRGNWLGRITAILAAVSAMGFIALFCVPPLAVLVVHVLGLDPQYLAPLVGASGWRNAPPSLAVLVVLRSLAGLAYPAVLLVFALLDLRPAEPLIESRDAPVGAGAVSR